MTEQNLQERLEQCRKDKVAIEEQEKGLLEQIELQKNGNALQHGDIVTCEWGRRIVLYDCTGKLAIYNMNGTVTGDNDPNYYQKTGSNLFIDNLFNLGK